MMGGGGAVEPTYLFRDLFTTAEAAPMATPHASEPGPGAWDIVDTGNRLSVASGKFTLAGDVNAEATAQSTEALNLAVGRGAIFKIQRQAGHNLDFGLAGSRIRLQLTNFYVNSGGLAIGPNRDDEFLCALVLRNPGLWIIDLTNNVLLYTESITFTSRKLYFGTGGIAPTSFGGTVADVEVKDLAGGWTTQYGPALGYVAAPANGETIAAATANGQVETNWTPTAGGTIDLQVRRTDDDNCLIVRADQTGSTIKLIKKEGGSESELASNARTWTAGTQYQITAYLNGTNIRTMDKAIGVGGTTLRANVTNTYNQAVGGAKLVCAGTIAHFTAWPRSIAAPNFL